MLQLKSRRLAVAFLTLTFSVPSGLAQKTKTTQQSQDPMSKPRNEKVELKRA